MAEIFETELSRYGHARRTFWKKTFNNSSKSWGTYYRNRLKKFIVN